MNIVITGGSKGLGLVTTKSLLLAGYTVYAISRSKGEIGQLENEYPGKIHFLDFDLSNVENIKEAIFRTWLKDVPIHGFVNNAALAYDTLLTNMEYEKLLAMTKINQLTPMMMTKYIIRNMILHNIQGSIVHITSVSVHTGYKGLSMYASTKGALEAFSKNAAREWGVKGIRSNCIAAGFMETDMTSEMEESKKARLFKRTSLKQATDKQSVADSILFLLSNGAKSITGQVLHVDSGTI